jgi:HEPN domain-containing protein
MDGDLQAAKTLSQAGDNLRAVFFLQQSCEKALKACFIFEGKEYPYIHDLFGLAQRGISEKLKSGLHERYFDLFEDLTPFYIKTRYPAYKKGLAKIATQKFTEEKIRLVEEFITWLKPKLK